MRFIHSFGYAAKAVADGREAFAYLKCHTPSLILLDMMVPGSGEGLDTYMKLGEQYPDIPVVIVSGHGCNDRTLEAIGQGPEGFVEKPYALNSLGQVVTEHLAPISAD